MAPRAGTVEKFRCPDPGDPHPPRGGGGRGQELNDPIIMWVVTVLLNEYMTQVI